MVIELQQDNLKKQGDNLRIQKKYEEAIVEYTKAIEIDPYYIDAYNGRSIAYKKLGNDEEAEKDIYKVKLIEIKLKDRKFCEYIERTEYDITKKIQIYDLLITIIELKDKLLYKESKVIGHYTKICKLKDLIKPKHNEDGLGEKESRLRLNNVSYMNDPTEGQVFIKLLKQCSRNDTKVLLDNLYNNLCENNRQILSGKNNVFLVSFSSAIDTSLPMWIQYCEDGEGCCLIFKSTFFDKENKNPLSNTLNEVNEELSDNKNYYCLYQIKYIQSDNDIYKLEDEDIIRLIEKVGQQLISFKDDLNDELKYESSPSIKVILKNILDQVRFLFKDKNYDHEEEVRLVKFEDNGNVKYTTEEEGFRVPHVYIDLERELEIEEVILGPKVENPIEIANYLYYTDKVKVVSRSRIRYK